MTTEVSNSLRKAAVLLRSLDADSATVLLSQLSADEARAVRQAMRELGEVDPLEQEELRDELRGGRGVREPDMFGGVELDFSIEANDIGSHFDRFPAPVPAPREPQPFDWLEGNDLPTLAAMLDREHLSTVAVVLSHLPPDRASQVLAALPISRRAAALERLADLGESDRASLEVIERQLADWIATQKAERQRRADRLRSIQAILEHSPRATCDAVLSELARSNQSLAAEVGPAPAPLPPRQTSIRDFATRTYGEQAGSLWQSRREQPPMEAPAPTPTAIVVAEKVAAPPVPETPFEIVATLNAKQLTELFRHCSVDRVVLALAGASDAICQQVERQLPKSIGRELRRRMHSLASVRLSDLAQAQRDVATKAAELFQDADAPQFTTN
ncbi:FliG C-terminal domain-containing protein [Aeoliella sp. SH292]|uniref:FliG C-terminal domain-containing protein n=1 Tax=Aeoliella sp. SH292 TaxID=3454464 RepID=UPI003F96FFCA